MEGKNAENARVDTDTRGQTAVKKSNYKADKIVRIFQSSPISERMYIQTKPEDDKARKLLSQEMRKNSKFPLLYAAVIPPENRLRVH